MWQCLSHRTVRAVEFRDAQFESMATGTKIRSVPVRAPATPPRPPAGLPNHSRTWLAPPFRRKERELQVRGHRRQQSSRRLSGNGDALYWGQPRRQVNWACVLGAEIQQGTPKPLLNLRPSVLTFHAIAEGQRDAESGAAPKRAPRFPPRQGSRQQRFEAGERILARYVLQGAGRALLEELR